MGHFVSWRERKAKERNREQVLVVLRGLGFKVDETGEYQKGIIRATVTPFEVRFWRSHRRKWLPLERCRVDPVEVDQLARGYLCDTFEAMFQ